MLPGESQRMSDVKGKRWPGETDAAHPEIFTQIPSTQPSRWKQGQLTYEQLKTFFADGFLVLNDFFKPSDLDCVKIDVGKIVDVLAEKLHKANKITSLYEDEPLSTRLIKIDDEFPGAAILIHKMGILPETFKDLWSNPRLLNIAEQILGSSDIQGHPVWNIRPKVPKANMGTVPWHQDVGYLDKDSYDVMQLAAWIPLVDATKENGCLQMIRGGHRTGRVARHTCCWKDTWFNMLDPDVLQDTLEVDIERDSELCEISLGSIILFNNLTPHRSFPNQSDHIRWSLDLRWQRTDKPVGFFGLKHGVTMRSSEEQNYQINWDDFKAWPDEADGYNAAEGEEFDTTNPGPWLLSWEMVHTNRHTDALSRSQVKSAA